MKKGVKKGVKKGIKRVGMLVIMLALIVGIKIDANAGNFHGISTLSKGTKISQGDEIFKAKCETVTFTDSKTGQSYTWTNYWGETKFTFGMSTFTTYQEYVITGITTETKVGTTLPDGDVPMEYTDYQITITPVEEETEGGGSGDSGDSGDTGSAGGSDDGMTAEEREAYEREQWEKAWKVSVSNPDNYLPKVTLSDGSEVQSTVPSHYTEKKDSGVAGLLTTQAQRDFHAALGITGNGYAHMNAYQSQCGPKMRELLDAYAKSLGALLGNDMAIGDIIELQMEVREKDTYKLVDTVAESSTPIELMVALKGDLLEKAEAGNELVLLCYADGELSYYVDTDAEASTLTVSTTKTSGIFAIAYAPKGTFTEMK